MVLQAFKKHLGGNKSSVVRIPPQNHRPSDFQTAVAIALSYFNGDGASLAHIRARARAWADSYFEGCTYPGKCATELLKRHPDLFNLSLEGMLTRALPFSDGADGTAAHLRLRQVDEPAWAAEPDAEDTTYPFPLYEEPLLISLDSELDVVLAVPTPAPQSRITATHLRGTAVLMYLPEFLGQLANADLELETRMAEATAQGGSTNVGIRPPALAPAPPILGRPRYFYIRTGSIVCADDPSLPLPTPERFTRHEEAATPASAEVGFASDSNTGREDMVMTLRTGHSSTLWMPAVDVLQLEWAPRLVGILD